MVQSHIRKVVGWTNISSVGEVQRSYAANMLMRDYMRALVGSSATIVMDPTVAALLKDVQSFKTKEALSQWFAENVEKTVASFLGNGVASGMSTSFAAQGLEPYATWVKLPPRNADKTFQQQFQRHSDCGGWRKNPNHLVCDRIPARPG
jgi:hypothetical protein